MTKKEMILEMIEGVKFGGENEISKNPMNRINVVEKKNKNSDYFTI